MIGPDFECLCRNNHQPIAYDGEICPLCWVNEDAAAGTRLLADKDATIARLRERLGRLCGFHNELADECDRADTPFSSGRAHGIRGVINDVLAVLNAGDAG